MKTSLYIIIIIVVNILFPLIAYIKLIKGGSIISKHKYKEIKKNEILLVIMFILTYCIYKFYYLKVEFDGTILVLIIYVIILNTIHKNVLVTNSGFYCSGKYIKWKQVIMINKSENKKIIVTIDEMIKTGFKVDPIRTSEIKIQELENQEAFLEIASEYSNLK